MEDLEMMKQYKLRTQRIKKLEKDNELLMNEKQELKNEIRKITK